MRIRSLTLQSFRAHGRNEIHFDPGVNLLVGPNGAGKTNVLEAIHVLCLTRSFLTSNDRFLLRRGDPHYDIRGMFEADSGRETAVRAAYVPGEGKRITVGGATLERASDMVGRFPVVVFSPDDQRITAEGPEHRRRLMDNIICQSSSVYLDNLLHYRRVLKQRNELLSRARRMRTRPDAMLFESWTQELLRYGAAIFHARIHFAKEFSKCLSGAHARISSVAERPWVSYEPLPGLDADATLAQVQDAFADRLETDARTEADRGMTRAGPHRDEITMYLDDFEVRRYGSQGQHRTFGMALKLAQYTYLFNKTEERPLLLLDDVFDNLDPARITAFLNILLSDDVGQSVTTAARREIVHAHIDESSCCTITVGPNACIGQRSEVDSDSDVVATPSVSTDSGP